MTNAGPMREVIRLERRSTTQDDNGEPVATWTTVGERRAEKLAFPGRELYSSQERHARVPTVFRLRYPKEFEVTPDMRVVHKEKVFNIISAVDENGRGVDMLLSCEELVGEPE